MENTCTFTDFMKSLKPWLSRDYIREAAMDDQGGIHLKFTDGITDIYRVTDCSASQIQEIAALLKQKNIPVSPNL
ncbi:MAG: hypothetical protein R6U29_04225 [Desulfosudaceae bacterium]